MTWSLFYSISYPLNLDFLEICQYRDYIMFNIAILLILQQIIAKH